MITGGANGIGYALVEQVLARRAAVVVIDDDAAGMRALLAAYPCVDGHVCDVADAAAIGGVAGAVRNHFGRVDLLVNDAAISVAGHVEEIAIADLERVLAVNFWGVFHCCRAFLPLLRIGASKNGATICNVLSDFAMIGVPGKAGYAASKHAARALTQTLTAELAGSGINVLAAYPGATATDLVRRGRAVDARKQATEHDYLMKGMKPDYVAQRILRAVERSRTTQLIGAEARLIAVGQRFAPALTQWAIRRFWRRVPFL